MSLQKDFTKGKILLPLVQFAVPVMGALVLQSLYGAVDLLVVGRFGSAADVSAVSTGAQIMNTLTHLIVNLAVGVTVLLGQYIGAGRRDEAGSLVATGIKFFGILALLLSVLIPLCSGPLSALMNAPQEAFEKTKDYVRICGMGFLFICSYNLLGAVFRGMGDSATPLLSVAIAAVFNIFGDLYFVRSCGMGAGGAALATVLSQGISILLCLIIIKKRGLPFAFGRKSFERVRGLCGRILRMGAPLALQSLMVSLSFMVILAIINDLGLVYSAGMGVAEKVTAFIMIISEAFSQGVSSFTAQNIGAGRPERAKKALRCGIGVSVAIAVFIGSFTFFRGNVLTGIFTDDPELIYQAWQYLKAYAVDTLFTAVMFCFVGYFSGRGCTGFVMLQGIISAFCVRIPVSYLASRMLPVSLFRIGLATPASTLLQIFMCLWYYRRQEKMSHAQKS